MSKLIYGDGDIFSVTAQYLHEGASDPNFVLTFEVPEEVELVGADATRGVVNEGSWYLGYVQHGKRYDITFHFKILDSCGVADGVEMYLNPECENCVEPVCINFDVITCCDVLECITPETVNPILGNHINMNWSEHVIELEGNASMDLGIGDIEYYFLYILDDVSVDYTVSYSPGGPITFDGVASDVSEFRFRVTFEDDTYFDYDLNDNDGALLPNKVITDISNGYILLEDGTESTSGISFGGSKVIASVSFGEQLKVGHYHEYDLLVTKSGYIKNYSDDPVPETKIVVAYVPTSNE